MPGEVPVDVGGNEWPDVERRIEAMVAALFNRAAAAAPRTFGRWGCLFSFVHSRK